MPRHLIGLIAAILLLGAVVLFVLSPSGFWAQTDAFLIRLGAIVFFFWLAWNDLRRIPSWLLVTLPVAAIVLARWPRWFLVLIPALIVIGFLRKPLRAPPKNARR